MTETETPEVRYPQVLRAISETPIAMLRGSFEVMLDIVGHRLSGERFSKEEIEARVGSRASSSPSSVVGSVAVLPIYGAIIPKATLFSDMSGGTSIEQLQEDFRGALADEAVKAIVFDVDSPGGMVTMVPEFASEIRAARGQKPMVAVASPRAASAAYWLASQADEFVATPSGDVGSIGVFNAHQDVSAMQEKMGVKTTYVSAGKYKTEGNASEPLSEEAVAAIQARVDEMYDVFTGDVAKARGVSVQAVKNGYGEGRMLSAAKALAEGMIDRVDTLEHVVGRLQNGSGRARVASRNAEAVSTTEPAAATTATTVTIEYTGLAANLKGLGAGLGPTFTDEVEEAHRALEAVVTRAEGLRSLTGTKREQIAELVERGSELLARSEPETQADDEGLELEHQLVGHAARLRR